MRSIFGRVNFNKKKINYSLIEASSDAILSENCMKSEAVSSCVAFIQVNLPNHSAEKIFENSKFIVLSDCRIDNRSELNAELGIQDQSVTDQEIALYAYLKWGTECGNYLLGDFVIVIWDKNKEQLFCLRDHFGVVPLYYYNKDGVFVFGTEIKSILKQKEFAFSIDQQYVVDTISMVKSEKFRTNFKEIKRVPPGHYLVIDKTNIELVEYWRLEEQKKLQLPDEEIVKRFKELLFSAVSCRIDHDKIIGSELSGGLDSSTITAIASVFINVKTFSHLLADKSINKIFPYKDERDFVNRLVDYSSISDKFSIISGLCGLVKAIEINLDQLKYITQQNFNVFSDQLYVKAQFDEVSVLLSGYGGDEIVSSKASSFIDELLVKKDLNSIIIELKKLDLKWFVYSKLFIKYTLKVYFPLGIKFIQKIISRKPEWKRKFKYLAFNDTLAKQMKLNKRYCQSYEKSEFTSNQLKCIENISHSHVSQRLEYCYHTAKSYGIEYRYPLLDIKLIEFYLSMPSHLKNSNERGRFAIRKAIEGIVPKKIQWREDKSGSTIPTVYSRFLKDKEYIGDIIKRSKKNLRVLKYLDIDKLERWYECMIDIDNSGRPLYPSAFYNNLKLILFIEKYPEYFEE